MPINATKTSTAILISGDFRLTVKNTPLVSHGFAGLFFYYFPFYIVIFFPFSISISISIFLAPDLTTHVRNFGCYAFSFFWSLEVLACT